MTKIVPKTVRDSAAAAYTAAMVILKRTTYRRPVTTEQAPSTAAILSRDPSKDVEHFNRPLPENWKAVPNAKSTEEAIGMREDFRGKTAEEIEEKKEVYFYRHMQHRADRNDIGQPDLVFDKEARRTRAIEAFLGVTGTGRRYWELTSDEKKKIKNYFFDMVSDLSTVEVLALTEDRETEIDAMLQQELVKV